MNVMLAEKSGFCFGVERAVKIAENAIKEYPGKNIFTYGELIHNPSVVRSLNNKGIKSTENLDILKEGDVLIIRSHGAIHKVFETAIIKGVKILDATCPHVKKAQNLGAKLNQEGYDVIVLGSKDHPEVKAIVAYSNSKHIISKIEDIKNLKSYNPAIITQTTLSKIFFGECTVELKKKYPSIKIYNTICNATSERQISAKNLAENVELMIVIGGKNSSNTNKLSEICKDIVETKHIEEPIELKKEWFIGKKNIGITAGASTPQYLVDSVIKLIKNENF